MISFPHHLDVLPVVRIFFCTWHKKPQNTRSVQVIGQRLQFKGYRLKISGQWLEVRDQRFQLKIILKIFVKIYTIGYFCRDSAKNKFLDLFSALTAPKIRAVRRSIVNSSPKARYSSAFSVEIFVKDYIFSCLSARCFGGNLHVKSKDLNGPEIYLRLLSP